MTIQYRTPVRLYNYQRLTYTFLDGNNTPIDLSTYSTCAVELKLGGDSTFTTAPAGIPDPTNGVAQLNSVFFAAPGVWTAQFYVADIGGVKLYGEPIQFRVVKNVEDAGIGQLLPY